MEEGLFRLDCLKPFRMFFYASKKSQVYRIRLISLSPLAVWHCDHLGLWRHVDKQRNNRLPTIHSILSPQRDYISDTILS